MNNQVNVMVRGAGSVIPYTYKTVVLKPNFIGQRNVLTQIMVSEPDTKYVIKYDFTLNGGITGTADIHYISTFINPGYAAAHEAWITADQTYTDNPTDENRQLKLAAYEALQANPQYYYYDRKQVIVRAGQYVDIPDGCVLFNAGGVQVEFPNGVAEVDTVVYICSLTQGDYEYSLTNAIVIPEGCLIEFDGGSISNGVIVCNNTIFVYNQPEETVLKNIELLGDYEMNVGGGNADKKDNTNGMGKIYLKKNKSFKEQLTQDNTIYVIRYDFDLTGEEVTIPDNCVLEFDGGSLSNGTISGTILNEIVYSNWFKDIDDFIDSINNLLGYKTIEFEGKFYSPTKKIRVFTGMT